MTICIAAICRYVYKFDDDKKPIDTGSAIITASDRMLTAPRYGVEYEANLMKRGRIGNKAEILAAGDLAVHSEVLARTHSEINPLDTDIKTIADTFAKHFRA